MVPAEEEYLSKKLAHLLFEVMEFPAKREMLYLALCHCQLAEAYGTDEIPLTYLAGCLEKYLVKFDRYPWRDFALEYEIYTIKEGTKELSGAELITAAVATERAVLALKTPYKVARRRFCKKIVQYWRFLTALEVWNPPRSGGDVIKTVKKLSEYNLFEEANLYLEEYLPYFTRPEELLLFRLFKLLNHLNGEIERENPTGAAVFAGQLEAFVSDFKRELTSAGVDAKKLLKGLKRLKKHLKRGSQPPYLRVESVKRENLLGKILRFFKP